MVLSSPVLSSPNKRPFIYVIFNDQIRTNQLFLSSIDFHYYFFLPAIASLSLAVGLIIFRQRLMQKKYWKSFWIAVIFSLFIYGLFVGLVAFGDIKSQIELNQFDLNGDGFYSGDERTKDYEEAMFNYTSDTGKNFSVIFGLGFSAIVALPVLLLGLFIEWYKGRINKYETE